MRRGVTICLSSATGNSPSPLHPTAQSAHGRSTVRPCVTLWLCGSVAAGQRERTVCGQYPRTEAGTCGEAPVWRLHPRTGSTRGPHRSLYPVARHACACICSRWVDYYYCGSGQLCRQPQPSVPSPHPAAPATPRCKIGDPDVDWAGEIRVNTGQYLNSELGEQQIFLAGYFSS